MFSAKPFGRKILMVMVVILLSTCHSVAAMPLLAPAPAAALPMPQPELEVFIDNVVLTQMSELGVPGVAVSVVRDGQVLLSKGYGFSDLEQQIPVDAANMCFRIGSISKIFAYTAIMQLVEQGRIGLEDDINLYLPDWKVPSSPDNPVRVWQLLSHTSGLRIPVWGKGYKPVTLPLAREAERPDLGAYLQHNLKVVYPPSEMYSYSDTGAVLAGYLVEVVSGLSYPEYIEQNILTPLEMRHTSTVLEPNLVDHLSKSYVTQTDGTVKPYPLLALSDWPAGSMYATATDMARFMLFQLGSDSAVNPVLSAAGLDKLHSRAFAPNPDLPGTTLSFFESCDWGTRALRHGGGFNEFVSDMLLFPGLKVGIFVATNHGNGGKLAATVLQKFTEAYIRPAEDAASRQRTLLGSTTQQLSGHYDELSLLARTPYTLLDRILANVRGEWKVEAKSDGNVLVTPPGGGPESYAVYVDLLASNGEDYMAFLQGSERTYLLGGIPSRRELRQLSWFELRSVQRLLWLTALILLTLALLGPIILLLVTKRARDRAHRAPLVLSSIASAGVLLFLVGCVIALPAIGIISHPVYLALQILIALSAICSLAFFIVLGRHWRKSSAFPRVIGALSAVGFCLFFALAAYWNLFDMTF